MSDSGGGAAPSTTTAGVSSGGRGPSWAAGWALVAVGVVSAGVGAGLGVNVAGLAEQARKTPQVDAARYDQLVNDGKTQGYVADALFGVALVGAVTGAVLLLTSGPSSSTAAASASASPVEATAVLAPVPGGAALSVQGRF